MNYVIYYFDTDKRVKMKVPHYLSSKHLFNGVRQLFDLR